MCHMKGASSSVVGVGDILRTLIDLRGHTGLHHILAIFLVLILVLALALALALAHAHVLDLELDNLLFEQVV